MTERAFLCNVAELPAEGAAKEFTVGNRTLCVARVNGELAALDNVCLHRGGPLGQGTIEGGKIICPWHGWAFDPKSGEAVHSAMAKVQTFRISIEGDDVVVEL